MSDAMEDEKLTKQQINLVHKTLAEAGYSTFADRVSTLLSRPATAGSDVVSGATVAVDREKLADWDFDMSAAPKDGTLLQLLVEAGEDDTMLFDNANPSRTMGFNNVDHDGDDKWVFPGWDWGNDFITSQGTGKVIAWACMLEVPNDAALIASGLLSATPESEGES